MELHELRKRLTVFCRAMYGDDGVWIADLRRMPGHAGVSYGFRVAGGEREESWYLRLPPPDVQWKGTADVLRQAAALRALDETAVPHCSVKWSGDDLTWFGRPYLVVPLLEGDILRFGPGGWANSLTGQQLHDLGVQVMTALSEIHRIDWEKKAPVLGPPIPFETDVTRWDRFHERSADPERLAKAPELRRKLLERMPEKTYVGIFHGDFQLSNFFCSFDGRLLAVIDWELVGIGATLNDVGWIATFSDPEAWSREGPQRPMFLDPETLTHMYEESYGSTLPDMTWFRALAAYKFAIITGLNLSLHRRGKRHDPLWEDLRFSMNTLMERALELLG